MKRFGKSYRRVSQPARDWRMAILGSGCTALGAACLLLAACSTAPRKPSLAAPEPKPAAATDHVVAQPPAPATGGGQAP